MKSVIYLYIWLLALTIGCKEKYTPDVQYPNTGYLVVEGFINSGKGATNIRLSRTVKLTDSIVIRYEAGANVTVEGDDNRAYTLSPQPNGLYTNPQLSLTDTRKYRLHIKTIDNREYLSDFRAVIKTPPLDSIGWTRDLNGVQLNVNTHDVQNRTWYYTWNYEETWEFRAIYKPTLKYARDPNGAIIGVTRINANGNPDTTGFRCWQFNNSTDILIGSSIKLSQDIIHLPLQFIENASWKLSELYSIKVYQHGVSAQGYEFLQRMKKNTQQVGSIFDSQPSELNSNIHNVNNSTEPVIGFVDVADAQELRIFISSADVPGWRYKLVCEEQFVLPIKDSLAANSRLNPVDSTLQDSRYVIHLTSPVCSDCRERGSNQKPSYWPR
jgi:hypothetical protein